MPRRRPLTQTTSDHVTAPATTTKAKVKTSEIADPVIESKIENDIPSLVDEPSIVEDIPVEAPVTASKTISSDIGIVESKEEPRPYIPATGAPNGLILDATEPVRLEGDDCGNYVVVKRDVYREVFPLNARRPSYFLVFNKGQKVLKTTLTPLN